MSVNEQLDLQNGIERSDVNGACIEGVMNPNWPGRLCWDLGVIVVVLIDAMILPFQMAFLEDESFFLDVFWLWLTTSFFLFDMILSVLTAYTAGPNEPNVLEGKLVTDKWRIMRNYARTWFPIDFASTIPWGVFADVMSGGGGDTGRSAQMAKLTKIIKFVRFLRLMRMLRLAKLATIWERVEASLGNLLLQQSVAMFRVLFMLISICHWNACIWWMIGNPESIFTEMLSEEAKAEFNQQRHWTTEVHNGVKWIDASVSEKYIFCFYWTLGVMRTMPSEVKPVNLPERLYVMVFMFFAFSAFAICVALITQTFFKFSERKRIYDDDMAAVRSYMRNINASESVQTSVKAFLRHLYDRRRIQAKEDGMLRNLPPSLLSHWKSARINRHIDKLSILKDLPPKARGYIVELAQIQDLAPGTRLCRKGREVEAAFVLVSGRLAIREEEDEDDGPDSPRILPGTKTSKSSDEKLFCGGSVDEECLLHASPLTSEFTLIASVCAEVLRIDRTEFFKLMLKYEDFKRSFSSTTICDMMDGAKDATLPRHTIRRPTDTNREATLASTAAICS